MIHAYRIGPDIIAAQDIDQAKRYAITDLDMDPEDVDADWRWVPLCHQITNHDEPDAPLVCIGDLIALDGIELPYVIASSEY